MDKQEWEAHVEAKTLHHAGRRLHWAWFRLLVIVGLPRLARFVGVR